MATKQLPGLTTLLPADSIDSSADLMLVRDTSTGADVKVKVGTVVGRDHGTAANQVPLNSDIYQRIGSSGPASCRNKIRNPRFSVNQRAVSGTVTLAAGAFGHDGWKGGASGCTYTFSTTQGRTTLTITAGSLVQTVDGLDLAAGSNTHTLSWGGTCQGKIGAGGYGASGITGSAIGGTNISVEFGIGTLYEPQFEIGTIASAFDCLPDWLELERCRKYLPGLSGLYCPLGVGQALSATTAQLSIRFSPRPNATLTGLSISSPSHIQVLQADGSAISPTGVAFNVAGQDGLSHINLTGLSGLVAGNACNIYGASASFRLLATGAEL